MFRALAVSVSLLFGTATLVPAAEIIEAPELEARLAGLRVMFGGGEGNDGAVLGGEADDYGPVQVLRIRGPIARGDAETLRAFFEDPAYYRRYVVLDSPGGSFTEGLRIGEVFREFRGGYDFPVLGGVFVLNGDTCLSACTLAFAMAATRQDWGGRFVESGAELGFHMGFLPDHLADQTAAVRDAMNLGYDVSAGFMRVIIDGASPPELLANALQHRTADSFYWVSADYEARFLGFNPVSAGVTAAPAYADALSKNQLNEICVAMHVSQPGNRFLPDEADFARLNLETEALYEVQGLEQVLEVLEGQVIVSPYCAVQVDEQKRISIKMKGLDSLRASCDAGHLAMRSKGWCVPREDTRYHAFHPVTVAQLSVALGCSGPAMDANWEFAGRREDMGQLGPTWDLPVRRRVTLRSDPALSGARLGRLEPGETAHVIGCRQVADRQGVWYRVQAKGQTGWVSARFLGF
ncbi:MAG: SH3 domain-containing protein [Rhodobacteraceae bacterium]|nr:SH3 domain-containing protein [Paracoccaceae bacterium]